MNDARALILERVRRAVRTGRIPRAAVPAAARMPEAAASSSALLERFISELRSLGVAAHVAPTAAGVRSRVADLVGDRSVFSWDPDRLPYDAGEIVRRAVTAGATRADQARAELGVTGCHGAIAETGTIAVLSGAGTPRAASLLPPTHLCIVRTADLYPSIAAFFAAQSAAIAGAACCTFITGPSRTADIELTLTLGVHGPGEVIVVVGP